MQSSNKKGSIISEKLTTIYIRNKKYEIDSIYGYSFKYILNMLIRRRFLNPEDTCMFWGLIGQQSNEYKVSSEELEMKIDDFIESHLNQKEKEKFYIKFGSK